MKSRKKLELNDLPLEALLNILSYLDEQSLLEIASVSPRFSMLIQYYPTWILERSLIDRQFRTPQVISGMEGMTLLGMADYNHMGAREFKRRASSPPQWDQQMLRQMDGIKVTSMIQQESEIVREMETRYHRLSFLYRHQRRIAYCQIGTGFVIGLMALSMLFNLTASIAIFLYVMSLQAYIMGVTREKEKLRAASSRLFALREIPTESLRLQESPALHFDV